METAPVVLAEAGLAPKLAPFQEVIGMEAYVPDWMHDRSHWGIQCPDGKVRIYAVKECVVQYHMMPTLVPSAMGDMASAHWCRVRLELMEGQT